LLSNFKHVSKKLSTGANTPNKITQIGSRSALAILNGRDDCLIVFLKDHFMGTTIGRKHWSFVEHARLSQGRIETSWEFPRRSRHKNTIGVPTDRAQTPSESLEL